MTPATEREAASRARRLRCVEAAREDGGTTADLWAALCPETSRRLDSSLIERAMSLRTAGLTFSGVSIVMGHDHDCWYSPQTWRHWLRDLGMPATRPWNKPPTSISSARGAGDTRAPGHTERTA